MAIARLPASRASSRLHTATSRRIVTFFAIALLAVALVATHLPAGDQIGLRQPVADVLNTAIAWSDLNLGLWPRQGAARAVRLDPTLRTDLGRQGARWFAIHGTLRERLRWAGVLARRDRAARPLLQDAAGAALCSSDRRLRVAAVTALRKARLPTPQKVKGRWPC
jgi:hypothetical protein